MCLFVIIVTVLVHGETVSNKKRKLDEYLESEVKFEENGTS